jgi:uncharacterized lipoprotein NlpE involved in copper resistance
MKKVFSLLFTFLLILAGCSNNKDVKDQIVEKPVEVKILLPKDEININKEVTIRAEVTQDKKAVSDAEDIQFEIGKIGEDSLAMLVSKNGVDGIYSAKYTFNQPGNYYVVAHVSARDQHTMPKKEFTVLTANNNDDKNQHEHSVSTNEHHHGDLLVHLMGTENIVHKKENVFTIHVQNEGNALEKAKVRIETWRDEQGKHIYTNAKEISPGEYEVKYTFAEKGIHAVKVHVEKEAIHDHIEKEVNVN